MPVIEKHAHRDFIEAAAAAGWTVEEGPWGYADNHERSVALTRTLPGLDGSVRVWLMHRNIGKMVWDDNAGRWATNYPEDGWSEGVQAWHVLEPRGEQGLSITLNDVLAKGLDDDFWISASHTCDNCGNVVEHLNHVAFANKSCDECVGVMRARYERPGWCN